MQFQLHPRLAEDTIFLGRFELCQVLLMNDAQYPWCILVPEVADVTEIYQLNSVQRQQLMEESCFLAENLATLYQADKMNVANIGNIVTQLHIHHVVRYQTDKAFPTPIWGKFSPIPYSEAELAKHTQLIKSQLVKKLQIVK